MIVSRQADVPILHPVDRALRAALPHIGTGARVAVALSGGRDSMVLLNALACSGTAAHFALQAIHVHHGLSPNADAWAEFCRVQCAQRDIPLTVRRVAVDRRGGDSLEAVARAARLEAFGTCGADVIALAHHADDQAETVLLQLLRGAGPHGLAGMPTERLHEGRILWRPLLEVGSAAMADYAEGHALRWIDDESNADLTLRRNAVRHTIAPELRVRFPGYPGTLVRAALHQADAARLLDDLAELDAGAVTREHPRHGLTLDLNALRSLHIARPDRARNLLRWFVRRHGLPSPPTARLTTWLAQCTGMAAGGRMRHVHAGYALVVTEGALVAHKLQPGHAMVFAMPWRGEQRLELPGGTLGAERRIGAGIAIHHLAGAALTVRSRRGGERLRVSPGRPRQSLAEFLRVQGTPAWHRRHWPVLCRDDQVIAVPGMGVHPEYAAAPDSPGLVVEWQPIP